MIATPQRKLWTPSRAIARRRSSRIWTPERRLAHPQWNVRYDPSLSGGGGGTPVNDGDAAYVLGTFSTTNHAQGFFGGTSGPIQQAANGTTVRTGVTLPSGWSVPGGDPTFVSTARAYNGTKSILHRMGHSTPTGGTYDWNIFQYCMQYDPGAALVSAYFRGAFYLENNGASDGQIKWMRFTNVSGGFQDSDRPNILVNTYPGANGGSNPSAIQIESDGGPQTPNPTFNGPFWVFDGWSVLELFFVPGTKGVADGFVQVRCMRASDGAVIASGTTPSRTFWKGTDNAYRYCMIQGYFGNEMISDGVELNLDRDCAFVVNTTSNSFPETLALGDASTFAACNKATLVFQKITNRASGRLDFTANQGILSAIPSNCYGYVLNGVNSAANSNGMAVLKA